MATGVERNQGYEARLDRGTEVGRGRASDDGARSHADGRRREGLADMRASGRTVRSGRAHVGWMADERGRKTQCSLNVDQATGRP
jgi:hypothetical protein